MTDTKPTMKTTVEIEWDSPQEQAWLCSDNISIALHAYCVNTKFKVREIKSQPVPVEPDAIAQIRKSTAWTYFQEVALGYIDALQADLQRCKHNSRVTMDELGDMRDRAEKAEASLAKVMEAADALIKRWETPLWKDAPATANYIAALRDAISAEPLRELGGEMTDTTKQLLREVTLYISHSPGCSFSIDPCDTCDCGCRKLYDRIRAHLATPAQPAGEPVACDTRDCQEYSDAACPGNPGGPCRMQPAAQPAGESIGEMREGGVVWFKGNPHSFPVGTQFYAALLREVEGK